MEISLRFFWFLVAWVIEFDDCHENNIMGVRTVQLLVMYVTNGIFEKKKARHKLEPKKIIIF